MARKSVAGLPDIISLPCRRQAAEKAVTKAREMDEKYQVW